MCFLPKGFLQILKRWNKSKVGGTKNPMELHSCLVFASYYWKFISRFATVAKCRHQLIGPTNIKKSKLSKTKPLTTKKGKFEWQKQKECQITFSKLKGTLTNLLVLAYPNFSTPFQLKTNMSLSGLGTVLTQ